MSAEYGMGRAATIARPFPADEGYLRMTTSDHSTTRNDGTPKQRKRVNMHEGIAVWCDCCPCEAEPHWAALAEEMGMDLNDQEDVEAEEN